MKIINKMHSADDSHRAAALTDEFNLAKKVISATSDIRADRVDDVANRINAGGYNVSVSDLADRIMSQM